ncbi:type I-MYXAN CRISPR-associated protein Cmx8 [Crocosphaera sp. Alani8]|uniref:type I-MYXAN CRISPR-associated protein Cmx8 n=1 Tax=Crocosphaera sp. Alani8 TaxID=3038952 RepID=UPI00313D6206
MKTIELSYQLAELPSAQHRAGLAGLILMVREVHHQELLDNYENSTLKFSSEPDEYGLCLELNLEGLKALFDLTYKAFNEYRWSTQKDKDKDYNEDEIRERETQDKKGKIKKITEYRYSVVVPQGAFLPYWDNSDDDENNGLWIKLWRELMWNIIRDKPASRSPFNKRLTEENNYYQDTQNVWQSLKNTDKNIGQSGTYYLGAAASTAENIPQKDIIRYQFLLHFAPFVFQVYCPSILDKEGKRDNSKKSYAVIVPDVANLVYFCDEFQDVLENRSDQVFGYRPREALIDIPQEGALDVLRLIRERIAQQTGSQTLEDLILGAEVIHAEKVGNNVKFISISYVEPITDKVDRYKDIHDLYWCPWFRKQRLLNLVNSPIDSEGNLDEIPAWTGFDDLLSRIPRKWLEHRYFSHDARQFFIKEISIQGETTVNDQTAKIRDNANIVYKVCQSYVVKKLKSKYDIDWKDCQGNAKKENQYNETKTKIANEAFLAIRSRTESQAFIEYFVSILYPFIKKDEFSQFAEDLFNKTDEIRALTLLALSSQFSSSKKDESQDNKNQAA